MGDNHELPHRRRLSDHYTSLFFALLVISMGGVTSVLWSLGNKVTESQASSLAATAEMSNITARLETLQDSVTGLLTGLARADEIAKISTARLSQLEMSLQERTADRWTGGDQEKADKAMNAYLAGLSSRIDAAVQKIDSAIFIAAQAQRDSSRAEQKVYEAIKAFGDRIENE